MPLTPDERNTYEQLRRINKAANSSMELALGLVLEEDDEYVSNIILLARRLLGRLDKRNHLGLEEALAEENDETFVFRMKSLLRCATRTELN
ncbi:hypothetical protein A3J34_01875 [Candidatus Peribacteria bacterium RIFCSPLOWO2_02_FULL_51_10]|nr:MAG: hypothetical protein A3J34_01875 [Candidatus Peribacteria bacterium RIFCSPLOWO2_02_FULL_51_10]